MANNNLHPDIFGTEISPGFYTNSTNSKNILEFTSSPRKEDGPLASKDEEDCIKQFYGESFDPNDAWIQTYSGKRFTPLNPNISAIDILDIAHALSNICRFTGHSEFYSVAQHSVLVSYICNQENAFHGLMHDSSEAYCQDIASPIKKMPEFNTYREIEKKIQLAIATKFGFSHIEPEDVKKADLLLLATEQRDVMSAHRSDWNLNIEPLPFKIIPLAPTEAKNLFLKRFHETKNNKK